MHYWTSTICRQRQGTQVRAAAVDEVGSLTQLQQFCQWLLSNGVRGFGQADSPLALYEDEDRAERGIAAVQPIAAGQRLLALPLRLALTDYAGDPDAAAVGLEDAPWAVRLAAKLLREVQQGPASQWAPYLQVLPTSVPQLSEADATASEYSPLVAALRLQRQLADDWFARLAREATGSATLDAFDWALSVVHSRTFGSAAKGGGVGVRMMVPLLDMLNHGGDEKAGTHLPHVATDSVRWDLVPPDQAASAQWEVHLSATRDIEEGEEVLLSYGERHNDDFLVHYGFVPAGNPHDDVLLFPHLEAALEWFFDRAAPQRHVPELEARQLYDDAVQAADAATAELPASQAPELRLGAGCRVDPRLLAAFAALAPDGVAAAVALRCEELLAGSTPVLQDLRQLVALEADEYERAYWQLLLRQRTQAMRQLADSADFALLGSTADGGSIAIADDAAAVTTGAASDQDACDDRWRAHVEALAGLIDDSPPAAAAEDAGTTSSAIAHSPAHMRSMLLRFRVSKKLLLWNVLLENGTARHREP